MYRKIFGNRRRWLGQKTDQLHVQCKMAVTKHFGGAEKHVSQSTVLTTVSDKSDKLNSVISHDMRNGDEKGSTASQLKPLLEKREAPDVAVNSTTSRLEDNVFSVEHSLADSSIIPNNNYMTGKTNPSAHESRNPSNNKTLSENIEGW